MKLTLTAEAAQICGDSSMTTTEELNDDDAEETKEDEARRGICNFK